ncbi:MAG: ester cyclase [Rubrobacteraceae bacterium]
MSEANKALVRREVEEVFSKGNLDAAEEIYAPGYVGHEPTSPEDTRGVEGARRFVAIYREAFPDFEVTVEDQFADGDRVATRFTARGTHDGELEGVAPTGNRVEIAGLAISRVEGGKIAEDWTVFDALGLMQQIGAIPAPE